MASQRLLNSGVASGAYDTIDRSRKQRASAVVHEVTLSKEAST